MLVELLGVVGGGVRERARERRGVALEHLVEGERPIPPEGAIDEAVESAKAFCGADAPGFGNGVLAAVLRSVRSGGRPAG